MSIWSRIEEVEIEIDFVQGLFFYALFSSFSRVIFLIDFNQSDPKKI